MSLQQPNLTGIEPRLPALLDGKSQLCSIPGIGYQSVPNEALQRGPQGKFALLG